MSQLKTNAMQQFHKGSRFPDRHT